MKKMIISITLVLILLLAATGGTLGWYFTRLENKIAHLPNYNWRINLNEKLTKTDLGPIDDNRKETILVAVKAKNSVVQIEDLYIKNATKISATVGVKSWSNLYNPDSSVNVNYIAELKTLATDVKQRSFPNINLTVDPNQLMDIVANANDNLEVGEVKIENVFEGNGIVTADLTVIKGSKVYLSNDTVKLYFIKSNQKLLSEVLTKPELGDIINNKEETILSAIKDKNKDVDLTEIEIVKNSIAEKEASVRVKENSKKYIVGEKPILVNYRIFNPNIGTVKTRVVDHGFDGNSVLSLVQLSNGTILAGTSYGSMYQLNPAGTVKTRVVDHGFVTNVMGLLQSSEDIILAAAAFTNNISEIYQLKEDGTIDHKVEQPNNQKFDSGVYSLVKVDNCFITDHFGWNVQGLNLSVKSRWNS
ncbi:hypothetical protein [Spiroplasma chrysopicola]|uniref:Uncharacterized protein n=1 Tax=Spiroplasma chrysopicola DF-1 TaxID=1276227 RepID=R4UI91_9MOLU|nr:hypothetical protein [Spiroplasma chrysopicola]AGM25031.1 hypothetical protein SCHRY_v1c04500 [Spiroplasma chrysopicola DF-1]